MPAGKGKKPKPSGLLRDRQVTLGAVLKMISTQQFTDWHGTGDFDDYLQLPNDDAEKPSEEEILADLARMMDQR